MSAYHMGDDFFSFGLNEDRKVLNLAPRVSRDRFHCSDPSSDSGFYVEMVEDMCMHRQARANPAKLYAVLTYKSPGPVLTKKGTVAKRQPPPYQDQPTNFYCAQLLHYGLKLVETREEAKEILLAAFGTDKTLAVPSHILKLQKEMQQEYRIANDKARAKYDEEKARKRKEVEDKRALVQKRHAELHAMLTETPHQNSGADSSKKRKAAPSDGDQTGSSKAKGNKKAPSKAAKAASKSSESKIQTSGEFQVAAPYLEEQWGSTDQHWGPEDKGIYTLKMSPSPGTGRHLWMWFDFGVYSGVMRSTGPPPTTLGTPCAFLWRGKESGEGEMDFSDLNKGTITFLEGGKIRGTISGDLLGKNREFADVQIDSKVTVWTKEVRSWKREYRAINERAHYVSGLTRWGGWASEEGCTDDPVGSDTTDAGGQDDERHTDDEEYGDDGLGGDYGSHVEYDFDPYKVEPR